MDQKPSDMSNIVPADRDKLKLLRSIVINTAIDVTPDMVERGLVAYHNFQAMHGGDFLTRSNPMVRAILEAALGGSD